MRIHDTISGLAIFALGLAVVLFSRTFPPMPGQDVGPALFPALIGGALALAGVVLFGQGRRRGSPTTERFAPEVRERGVFARAAVVPGAVVFYVLAVETMGFHLAAMLLLAVVFLIFGVRGRWIVPLAAGVTLGMHAAFYTLLRVPLPWGWLEPFAW